MGFLSSLSGLFGGGAPKQKLVDISSRWELRRRSGQGSMSKVWHAYDRALGRVVCLKLLDKDKTARFEATFKQRKLERPTEGVLCMSLKHKNIVQFFEHGLCTSGEPYLVMEWVEGDGLNFLIENKSPKLNGNRIKYLIELADALVYLHGQRYLHRDICPRNVMVTAEGVLKLIDFGLTIPYTPDFCKPGNRTGTADYLAPEVIKRMNTDHRVDVFAFGVTAYEVITGDLPWERSTNSAETLRRHLNTPPRDPRSLCPDIDEPLAKLLLRAIDKEVPARIPSMAAFREALEALDRQDY